ncbi:MAG TPA: restriction endonuclease subunit S [Edaphocola sp.]|nr:restriction endonuclease subunit S [Edaphocola sp.]
MTETAIGNAANTAWLGEFPSHWQVIRIKNLFQEMDSRSETGSEELLSVSHYTGVTLKRESLENEDDHLTNAASLVGYKLVQQGDLVINIMLAWNGSLGISPYNGMTSPAYCVYRIKGDNNPEYFGYLFTTNLFKAEFRRHSTGIIDSRLRLYSDKFFSIFTVVPPKVEQDEIVQYIKTQEEKINLFIQKKQRFIELLKEQRQRVVEEVIKNGTNQKVEFKETGIGWLGKIPKHWRICRLKECGTYKSGDNITSEQIEPIGEYPVYGGNGLRGYFDNYTHDGDFALIGRQGALCGNINYAHGKFWASEHAVVVTLNQDIELYWFGETLKVMNLNQYSQSAAQPGISVDRIRALHMPLPPIEDQKQIVSHIKTETATIDTAIAKAEREIELIKEYKEAMISEAVMGKIVVSG